MIKCQVYFSELDTPQIQASPELNPPLGFNITHDNSLIALAFSRNQNPPTRSIGIDIMKLHIPGKESFPSFVHTVGDQVRS